MAKGRSMKSQAAEQEAAAQETAEGQEEQGAAGAEGKEELTEEQLEAQAKEQFESAVEEARADIGGTMNRVMEKHSVAVVADKAHKDAKEAWEKKNKKSLDTLAGAQSRLAAARTVLKRDWEGRVDSDEETTVGEGDDAIAFLNDLNYEFDAHADGDGGTGPIEKEYWLAASSFMRIGDSILKDPKELEELSEAAETAQAEYAKIKAVYDEALHRQLT